MEIKKVTALGMAAVMTMSLAACGSSDATTNTDTKTDATTTTDAAKKDAVATDTETVDTAESGFCRMVCRICKSGSRELYRFSRIFLYLK
ncbi:MAG: hypothetical protein IJC02_11460 [Lachnospiraceae bacterium]|nr:hypothetical protein [Lachnospiraceae bacterium]